MVLLRRVAMNKLLLNLLLALATVLLIGCSKKTEFGYITQANNYLQANDKKSAENTYKEGLLKYPKSDQLKMELFYFYTKTNRWKDAEDYYRIASFDIHDVSLLSSVLSTHFFDSNDWPKAYVYFMEEAQFSQLDEKNKGKCAGVSIEAYRNAAAAASLMSDTGKVKEAYDQIVPLANQPECKGDKALSKYLSDVEGWLPKGMRKK
jgi:hypothetical protein